MAHKAVAFEQQLFVATPILARTDLGVSPKGTKSDRGN